MRDLTKVFIEQYINLITENKFEDLYRIALREHVVIEDLTNSLLKADIYPLEHMSYIPQEFLYKSTKSIDGFIIPNNIVDIRERAFYETDLTEIIIPDFTMQLKWLAKIEYPLQAILILLRFFCSSLRESVPCY